MKKLKSVVLGVACLIVAFNALVLITAWLQEVEIMEKLKGILLGAVAVVVVFYILVLITAWI